jgi:hypothetical protein
MTPEVVEESIVISGLLSFGGELSRRGVTLRIPLSPSLRCVGVLLKGAEFAGKGEVKMDGVKRTPSCDERSDE